MDFVLFNVDYEGRVLVNNNLEVAAPFKIKWFRGADLTLKTADGEFILNTDNFDGNNFANPIRAGDYSVKPLIAGEFLIKLPKKEKPSGEAEVLTSFEFEDLKILLARQNNKRFLAIENGAKKKLVNLF
ncbi:MAG: hypothetical protein LBM01_02905 [Christensenellaceae bacterium]|jgi:hypothetical protein|nr:hypothetical protein [Christensenellaceae bacterium]